LVNGAGSFALQTAKAYETEVTGVDSTNKLEAMLAIGADHVNDYTKEDFTNNGQRYDMILDVAAYHSTSDYRRPLSPNGTYVSTDGSTLRIFETLLLEKLFSLTGIKQLSILAHKSNRRLDGLIELFETGKVVPLIDKRFPLSEVAEDFQHSEDSHVKGKIVITI
jgi:NADPH:quinone reductase-like Zn-dependent oxidoreductase